MVNSDTSVSVIESARRLGTVAVLFGLFAIRRARMLLRWFSRGWLAKEVIRKFFIRRYR